MDHGVRYGLKDGQHRTLEEVGASSASRASAPARSSRRCCASCATQTTAAGCAATSNSLVKSSKCKVKSSELERKVNSELLNF